MKHPSKEIQENQKKFLAKLPEEQREGHARLFRNYTILKYLVPLYN